MTIGVQERDSDVPAKPTDFTVIRLSDSFGISDEAETISLSSNRDRLQQAAMFTSILSTMVSNGNLSAYLCRLAVPCAWLLSVFKSRKAGANQAAWSS
jgi:hypothetical protein